jgi:hypothetical protein
MKSIENKNIISLKKNGFTNVKNFFEEEEILNLSKEIDRIYPNETINSKQTEDNKKEKKTESEINQDKFNYLVNGSDNNGTFGAPILGCSELIDTFMQKLFNNKYFTYQNCDSAPKSLISLAKNTSSKREILCLDNTIQNKDNYVNQLIFNEHKVSAKTRLIIFYLKMIVKSKKLIRSIIR